MSGSIERSGPAGSMTLSKWGGTIFSKKCSMKLLAGALEEQGDRFCPKKPDDCNEGLSVNSDSPTFLKGCSMKLLAGALEEQGDRFCPKRPDDCNEGLSATSRTDIHEDSVPVEPKEVGLLSNKVVKKVAMGVGLLFIAFGGIALAYYLAPRLHHVGGGHAGDGPKVPIHHNPIHTKPVEGGGNGFGLHHGIWGWGKQA